MNGTLLLQFLLTGIALGCVYAMVAVGFNIIYNATGIINLAQGEFVMLGGMVMIWGNQKLGLPLWAAAPFAVIMVAGVGILFERLAIRPLRAPSVLTLVLITIAGSFLFRGAALLLWGDQLYSSPSFLGDESVQIFGAILTRQHLLLMGTLLVVALALAIFFTKTLVGKAMRACAYNRTAARLTGINPRLMVMLAFGMSAGIGALAGAVLAPITGMEYENGAFLGLKGFCAAVLGGLGNNPAAVAAGILLGIIEALAAGYVPSDYKDAISLSILLAVLFIRPSGLFGKASLRKLSDF